MERCGVNQLGRNLPYPYRFMVTAKGGLVNQKIAEIAEGGENAEFLNNSLIGQVGDFGYNLQSNKVTR